MFKVFLQDWIGYERPNPVADERPFMHKWLIGIFLFSKAFKPSSVTYFEYEISRNSNFKFSIFASLCKVVLSIALRQLLA